MAAGKPIDMSERAPGWLDNMANFSEVLEALDPESLEELRLTSNLLETLPDRIGHFVNLRVLTIFAERLRRLPDALAKCTRLYTMVLTYTNLAELPDLSGCEELLPVEADEIGAPCMLLKPISGCRDLITLWQWHGRKALRAVRDGSGQGHTDGTWDPRLTKAYNINEHDGWKKPDYNEVVECVMRAHFPVHEKDISPLPERAFAHRSREEAEAIMKRFGWDQPLPRRAPTVFTRDDNGTWVAADDDDDDDEEESEEEH